MLDLTARLPARFAVLFVIGMAAGCASKPPHASTADAKEDVVSVRPGPHGHRFDMQQNGRKMTAEEFDAWMKARGIRVAKGAPAKPKPSAIAKRAR